MNPENLARGWALIAEGAELISLAYGEAGQGQVTYSPQAAADRGIEQPAGATPSRPAPEPPVDTRAPIDQGECPKHHKAWTMGRYGPFCSSQTDDPAWGKEKPDGKLFCKITPDNAPQYLRIQAAA